jgi:hypothetical protein
MSKTKLFIGSSKGSVSVARLVADRLENDGVAEVKVWDEGIFSLNHGFLETLVSILAEYDFAVLIWASDDITESKGESRASPRDNVVFECGLFMGALGRERVFIVYDESIALKIPSDLLGITLATYDGSRVGGSDAESAMRQACDRITRVIQRQRFPTIVGEWKSRYAVSGDPGHAAVIDDVDVKAARGGLSIISKNNPAGDYYIAYGRIVLEQQILGEWSSQVSNSTAKGFFMLTVNPRGTVMYGYSTDLDEHNATVYVPWVLAKNNGVDLKTIKERLQWGEQSLNDMTIKLPPLELA